MALHLSRVLLEEIRHHAEESYPAECCGLLAGRAAEGKLAELTVPMRNAREDAPGNRYLIDPDEFRRADETLANGGYEIVGYYHSHPDHPAVPSEFDRRQAWSSYTYLIVAVEGGRAGEVTAWRLAEDRSRFEAERLVAPEEGRE